METLDCIRKRRSIRDFSDQEIPYDTVQRIVEYGTWAPCSCNRQLWGFIVLHKSELKQHPGVFRHVERINANWMIVVTYHKVFSSQFYANIQSAAGAIQNMVLAATDMGIDSIWMAERGDEGRIRSALAIPDDQLMIATVCLGHSGENTVFPPARRPPTDVIHRGRFEDKQLFPVSMDPKEWTTEQITKAVDYSMRAKSPSKLFYLALQEREYSKLLTLFPKLSGDTLMAYDFSGELSTDLILSEKADMITVHSLSDNMSEFILERAMNFRIPQEKIRFVSGDLTTKSHIKKYDTIIIFKRLEKVPDPHLVFDSLVRNNAKKGTKIYLVLENKINAKSSVRWAFRTFRSFRRMFVRSFQQIEPVSLFGPFEPLSEREITRILRHPLVRVDSDQGLDALPGVQANAGPPFWGRKLIPSTRFEEMMTRSWFKRFFHSRIVELTVR